MDNSNEKIALGDALRLNFSLALKDGSIIDSNLEGAPVSMRVGDGSMLPGFEAALADFKIGAQSCITLAPAQAFGERQADNIQQFSKNTFSADMKLEVGLVVTFADAGGGELHGVIAACDGDKVEVDFNHPLAGREIVFTAIVHEIEKANK